MSTSSQKEPVRVVKLGGGDRRSSPVPPGSTTVGPKVTPPKAADCPNS
jgi:hypothetical protein